MKDLTVLLSTLLLCLCVACSSPSKSKHYELLGGNPQVDYIDFLNDSVCRFVAPGPIELTCPYSQSEGEYIIQINDMVSASLRIIDRRTLQGSAPFFDGLWVLR